MLFRFLSRIFSVITDKGKTCPRCGGTNTDCENSIWYCYDCQKDFG